MHGYDGQGLLTDWTPAASDGIPAAYRTTRFTGVDVLYVVAVSHQGTSAPSSWSDLTDSSYRDAVALPDPSFAASALGMLGYFTDAPGYGLDYFKALKGNGAKQLSSPDDVLTGVAQGTYRSGFALAQSAYAAQAKGSPIEVSWPQPGGIAIYAPIGVTTRRGQSSQARDFADFVASRAGQQVIADHGSYSVLPDVTGPPRPSGSPTVSPNWPDLFGHSSELLSSYAKIFGP
jgi:iron(III) transport system substrate-binding protein